MMKFKSWVTLWIEIKLQLKHVTNKILCNMMFMDSFTSPIFSIKVSFPVSVTTWKGLYIFLTPFKIWDNALIWWDAPISRIYWILLPQLSDMLSCNPPWFLVCISFKAWPMASPARLSFSFSSYWALFFSCGGFSYF